MAQKAGWIGMCVLLWAIQVRAAGEAAGRGDAVAGAQKAQVCTVCHGADGNSTVPLWPKIAGQYERYVIQQLTDFRKGEKGPRYDVSMYGIVQALSDQDIADLAAYFVAQQQTPGAAKPEFVALGEKIYRGGNVKTGVPACGGCHDPQGFGNRAGNIPRLSGQHAEYTALQLQKFKTGQRSNDPNSIMRDISQKMTDTEIQAVSSYASGLH